MLGKLWKKENGYDTCHKEYRKAAGTKNWICFWEEKYVLKISKNYLNGNKDIYDGYQICAK